jgi:hypothetical protein
MDSFLSVLYVFTRLLLSLIIITLDVVLSLAVILNWCVRFSASGWEFHENRFVKVSNVGLISSSMTKLGTIMSGARC